jgi:DNA/RNA endonuclease G (NUC1)
MFKQIFTIPFSAITLLILMACSPAPSDLAVMDNYIPRITHIAPSSQDVTITVEYTRLAGRLGVIEGGVALRKEGADEWSFHAIGHPTSPFEMEIGELDAESTYHAMAYIITRRGVQFKSSQHTFTTQAPSACANSWYEIPEICHSDDTHFITHYTTIDGERRRNYSMLYDYSDKLALWVAYPIHACYLGDEGRSDAWGFDPVVPRENQMNMYRSGFTDDNGYSSYDRGHQIPSADRTASRQANAATFYYTNMTPQQSSFNRGLWGRLEAFARENMPEQDTIFVVTGCVMTTSEQPTPMFATHNTHGDRMAVPRAYFKAMVRSRVQGQLPNDHNAECIAFWMPNASPTSSKLTPTWAISITRLEELCGFELFTRLSDKTKSTLDTSIWEF